MTVATERASRVQPVVLEGRHVRLEPLALDHARALLAAASGPRDTYGFTTVPPDEPSMLRYIEAALRDREAGRALPFLPGEGMYWRARCFFSYLAISFGNLVRYQ